LLKNDKKELSKQIEELKQKISHGDTEKNNLFRIIDQLKKEKQILQKKIEAVRQKK
jgi:cell division septum initiation protein DivIVA